MADVSITARADEAFVIESPQDGIEGEIFKYTLTVPYATTIGSTTKKNYAYRNRNDVTTTVMASSAGTCSGNVFTSANFTPTADARDSYVIVFKYDNGSQTEVKKLLMRIGLQEDEP